MERLDLLLRLVSVWLAANMAVIAYLAFIYCVNSVEKEFHTPLPINQQRGGGQVRARILTFNNSPSPHSGRRC